MIKDKLEKDLKLLKKGEIPEANFSLEDIESLDYETLKEIKKLVDSILKEGKNLENKLLSELEGLYQKKSAVKEYGKY